MKSNNDILKSSPQFILDIAKTRKDLNYKPRYIKPQDWLKDLMRYLNEKK